MLLIFSLLTIARTLAVTLPIVSYNIQSGSDISGVYNITRTGATIASFRATLVGVQEVDRLTTRHPGDDQPAILESMTGMTPVYGKMRNFQGGGYGVLVLSALPVLERRELHYSPPGQDPTTPEKCAVSSTNDYCQGAVAVRVHPTDLHYDLWFATTHLGLGGGQYNESVQLVAFLRTLGGPVILTGDFNEEPGEAAVEYLSTHMQDMWNHCPHPATSQSDPGYTFNSATPTKRIDFVFTMGFPDSSMKCESASVLDAQASDHRPVLVTLHL